MKLLLKTDQPCGSAGLWKINPKAISRELDEHMSNFVSEKNPFEDIEAETEEEAIAEALDIIFEAGLKLGTKETEDKVKYVSALIFNK